MLSIHEKLLKFLSAVGFICLASAVRLTSPWDGTYGSDPHGRSPECTGLPGPAYYQIALRHGYGYFTYISSSLIVPTFSLPYCYTCALSEKYRLNNLIVQPCFLHGVGLALEVGVK